ncbi:MAG: EcsC family protein [Deltaproteobacteria bacterium]
MLRRARGAIERGLTRAYHNVKVDAEKYLLHLRRAHGLPIASYRDMYTLPVEVLDGIADQTIRAASKFAALEGAGLGMGGLITMIPDVGILSGITIRMIQKLSLIYGFEFSTEEEVADLWVAAASATGVDIGKELLEKQVIERFVPRVIRRIAVEAGAEVAEKWAARVIPVLSAVAAGGMNYYFIRQWGRRAKRHFQERHAARRQSLAIGPAARTIELPPTPSSHIPR